MSWPLSGGATVYHPNRLLDFCHLITNNQINLLYWLFPLIHIYLFKHPSFSLSITFHTSPKSTILIRTLHIGQHYCRHSGPNLLGILCTWTNPSHNLSHQTFSGEFLYSRRVSSIMLQLISKVGVTRPTLTRAKQDRASISIDPLGSTYLFLFHSTKKSSLHLMQPDTFSLRKPCLE